MERSHRAVFLDRDGVICENRDDYVKSLEEFVWIPGAKQSICSLTRRGFKVVVITNQSAIGRGIMTRADVEKINASMVKEVQDAGGEIHNVYYCPHRPDEHCDCRKPRTALFHRAAAELGIDFTRSFLVGDALSDIEAGRQLGLATMLVATGRGDWKKQVRDGLTTPSRVVEDLAGATRLILGEESTRIGHGASGDDVPRVLVIVPAYNEEESIGGVVGQAKDRLPLADVLVVDDGSTDDTRKRGDEAGALVISLPNNLGIGGAVQTGYKFAVENGYQVAVRLDADGQHDASELPRLVREVQEGRADVVIGTRYSPDGSYKFGLARFLGSKFFSVLVSAIIRQKISDSTSGFVAVDRAVAEFCAKDYPVDYPEIESIISLRRAGFRITEIGVTMKPRAGGKSSIRWANAIYYMVKVLLAILISLLRRMPARRVRRGQDSGARHRSFDRLASSDR